jgi:lipopolysaccharide export LptBFGC system permease protein LptF
VGRKTILWCITVFFGASITFQAIKSATENSSQSVSLGLQSVALLVMIVAIVLIVRKRT